MSDCFYYDYCKNGDTFVYLCNRRAARFGSELDEAASNRNAASDNNQPPSMCSERITGDVVYYCSSETHLWLRRPHRKVSELETIRSCGGIK